MYRNKETGEFGLSEGDVRSHFTQSDVLVIWPDPFAPCVPFEAYAPAEPPAHNAATHKAVEVAPLEAGEGYLQQWKVVELSPDELAQLEAERLAAEQAARDAARIIITRTQGLIALFRLQGVKEDDVLQLIDGIEDPAARYEAGLYFRAANWYSDDPFVLMLAEHVGAGTPEQLQALFAYAKAL